VPTISRFYGILISMYVDEHQPPHFHAKYGEYEAQIEIATSEIINGELPSRALREWTEIHRDLPIDPLP
jgi:hypothetical protein